MLAPGADKSRKPIRPPAARRGDRIALVGLSGAGKTTIGLLLAGKLGWEFFDCDAAFETQTGTRIVAWVEANGWAAFRERESALLASALARDEIVIATGGGAVEAAGNRAVLAAATVIWLHAPPAVLAARLGAANGRPLLAGAPRERLAELAARRDPLYGALADLEIAGAQKTPQQLVARILRELNRKPMPS